MLIIYYLLKLKNRLNARLTVINIQWESFQHIPDTSDTSNTSNVVIGILTIRRMYYIQCINDVVGYFLNQLLNGLRKF